MPDVGVSSPKPQHHKKKLSSYPISSSPKIEEFDSNYLGEKEKEEEGRRKVGEEEGKEVKQ